jgi:hypothetical protein
MQLMKFITRSLAVSLAVAAVIALPTAVKAQANSLSESKGTATEESLNPNTNWCVRIPGWGLRCV